MKTKIFTICIMVAALAMFAPVAEAGLYKVTGGGVIEDDSGGEATLAISARLDGDVPSGHVLYINRDTKFKFHGTIYSFNYLLKDSTLDIIIAAESKGGESITILITDGGDEVIDAEDTITILSVELPKFGHLVRGNIKLHLDE